MCVARCATAFGKVMNRIIVQFDGLKYAGKTTLILQTAQLLFKNGYSVTVIPEWRTNDYGPQEIQSWIEYTFDERNHSDWVSNESVSDIVLVDRGFLSLKACLDANFPQLNNLWQNKIMTKVVESISSRNMYVFVTANRDTIETRAMKRDQTLKNVDVAQLQDIYKKLYDQLGVKPLEIDTTCLDSEQCALITYKSICEYKNSIGG